jgi:signal peptidase I
MFKKKRFYIILLLILFSLYICLKEKYFDIVGTSMYPALENGQVIKVKKVKYEKIKTSDIVVFKVNMKKMYKNFEKREDCPKKASLKEKCYKGDSGYYVKRVLAVAGDHVAIVKARLYINKKEITMFNMFKKTSMKFLIESKRKTYNKIKDKDFGVIQKGEFFVIGDNVYVSGDSRKTGSVNYNDIIGVFDKILK